MKSLFSKKPVTHRLFLSWSDCWDVSHMRNSFYILFAMCQRSKKCSILGFPIWLQILGHSSLIHLAMDVWRSVMYSLMTIPVANRNRRHRLWPTNSMPVLLPTSFAWKWYNTSLINYNIAINLISTKTSYDRL